MKLEQIVTTKMEFTEEEAHALDTTAYILEAIAREPKCCTNIVNSTCAINHNIDKIFRETSFTLPAMVDTIAAFLREVLVRGEINE